jgi:hypothetical protein
VDIYVHESEVIVLEILSLVNWAISVNRMLCRLCNHDHSHSEDHTQLAWRPSDKYCTVLAVTILYSVEVIRIDSTMVQNSLYLFLWYTSRPGNSVCTCNWALMHCCQNIICVPSLFTFYIHVLEGTSLPQSSMYSDILWNG